MGTLQGTAGHTHTHTREIPIPTSGVWVSVLGTEKRTRSMTSDLPARLGLKAPSRARLSGTQALRYLDPGLEPA
jgi:hypothetical protein